MKRARDALKTRHAVMVARSKEELREGSESRDYQKVKALLEKYATTHSMHVAGPSGQNPLSNQTNTQY